MVQRVGVIGAGQMGGGIAEVAAKSGSDVLVWEAKQEALDFGKAKIEKSLSKAVERGKLSEEDRDAALGRLTFTTSLEDFADRELVMEAIIENEEIKKDVFSKLDAIVTDKGAPLCSNTSSLPIQAIASATENPGRIIGLHFFNPVPVLPLVEVIPALTTDEATIETAKTYATEVLSRPPSGQGPLRLHRELPTGALPALRHPHGGAGGGHQGGHRHRHEARCVPPDGSADPGRHGRPRHLRLHRRCHARGVRRSVVRLPAAAAPHGAGRPPRSQDLQALRHK